MTDKTLSEYAADDVIDSRDLLERLDTLDEGWEAGLLTDDEADERRALTELKAETEGYAGDNWRDGVTFIADLYFEQYAEELADDIGAIDKGARWPVNHIDWKAAADDLRQDYTECEIYGVSYWYR